MKISYLTGGFNLNYLDIEMSSTLTVHNNSRAELFRMYPNPLQSGDLILKKDSTVEHLHVRIFDALGRRVYSTILTDESILLPRSLFSKGIYLVNVMGKNHFETLRLVVQ